MFELLPASEVRTLVQDALVYMLVILALWRGRSPERVAIGIWWVCFELPGLIYHDLLGYEMLLTDVDFFMAGRDMVAGGLWIGLALYANRNYCLWVAGLQLLAIGSHVARGLVESISPIGYVFLVVAPGWTQLLIMAIGFTRHAFRERKYGRYRDWRTSPPPGGPPSLLHADTT